MVIMYICLILLEGYASGADPRFQVRGGGGGGGGAALKKIAPSGGRRENCFGISCEKLRFYAWRICIVAVLKQQCTMRHVVSVRHIISTVIKPTFYTAFEASPRNIKCLF